MRINLDVLRDDLLLAGGWAVTLLASVWAWALHSQTIGLAGRVFGGTFWARGLLAFHVYAVYFILLLPLLGCAAYQIRSLRAGIASWMRSPGRKTALVATLAAFGLAQIGSFFDIGRLAFTVSFGATLAIVLAAILLFYGSHRLAAKECTLAMTWVALVVVTQLTLQSLAGVTRGQPRLPWAESWTVFLAACMLLLLVLPFLTWIRGLRAILSSALSRLIGISLWSAPPVFALLAITAIAYRIGGEGTTSWWVLQRSMAILALGLGGLVIISLLTDDTRSADTVAPGRGAPWFWGALGIIVLVYVIQAIRIGHSGLYFLNPDGVVYAIIARNFARGLAMIRGCWSPLMPLLLAPFIRLGTDPQVAQRVLAGAVGLAWTAVSLLLGRRSGLRGIWLVGLTGAMAIVALQHAFFPVTPDMLGALVLACYFLIVTNEAFLSRPIFFGVLAGLLGAVAFYAQSYNLPFFAVHIFLTSLLLVSGGGPWRRAIVAVAAAWAVAAVAVAPWVLALYARYGYLTLSTTGSITHAVDGPSQSGHPCWADKLCAEPADVLIPWEDPRVTDYPDAGWNVLGSWDNFRFEIIHTQSNVGQFLADTAFQLGPLPPLAIVLVLLALFVTRSDAHLRFLSLWSLMTCALYVSGYILFHNELRFFLAIAPIGIIAVFRFIQAGLGQAAHLVTRGRFKWAESLVFLSVILSFLYPRIAGLRALTPGDPCVATTVAQFSDKLVAPIAGSDRWINIIAYYSEKRTLGVLKPTTSAPDADTEFHRLGVRTYVVGNDLPLGAELLARGGYTLVAETNLCGGDYLVLRTPVP